jgi:2-(1,2-epoxy-1,2-dihydrophenyl)acetyl-CoA isomerase
MFAEPEDRCYLVELRDDVLNITWNRPEFGNATPPDSVPGLMQLFRDAQSTPGVRAILIRGTGKLFCAGADVGAFQRALAMSFAERRADFARRLPMLRALVEAVLGFDRPVIVAMRGSAAGAGLLYPLAADYVLGDETANFVFAHQRIGLSPDGGVTALLPQVVGTRMARTLVLTAAKVDADEALRLGLLTKIVPDEALDAESEKLAARMARAPQTAMIHAKRMLTAEGRTLAEMLDAETAGIAECVAVPDFDEGVTAFMEKRAAKFPSAL